MWRGLRLGSVLSLALAAGVSGTACTKTPPPRSGIPTVPTGQTLKVFAYPDYFGHNTLKAFEAATNNRVLLETYPTNEALLAALATGAHYDVIFPSSYALEQLLNKGQIREMPRERVPNMTHIAQEFRNPPFDPSLAHCMPYVWWLAGLGIFAPKEAPGNVPDSWKALLDPQASADFKEWTPRQVVMLDDMRASLGVALRSLGLSASTQNPADLAAAQKLLIAQLPRVYDYVEDSVPLLQSQKVRLGLAWGADLSNAARDRPELRFVVPREGTLLYVDYACVPRNAEHPEVGFAFLNHLLDPVVSAEVSNVRMLATPNTGARPLLEGEARWLWSTLESLVGQGKVRYELMRDVGAAQPLYDQVWRDLKLRLAEQKAERARLAAEAASAPESGSSPPGKSAPKSAPKSKTP